MAPEIQDLGSLSVLTRGSSGLGFDVVTEGSVEVPPGS